MIEPGEPIEAIASQSDGPATQAAAEAVGAADTEAAAATPPAAAAAAARPARRGGIAGFLGRLFGRIPRLPLRSRRGLFLVFVLVAGGGASLTVGGVMAISWTETADFCGRCHTMGPELKAYEMSPHREVACAECHVEPGIAGWVKAKIQGTKQLIQVLTGTFPTPIPPPNHDELPPTSTSCVKCHDVKQLVANGGPIRLVLRTRYELDEPNSRITVALVFRPTGFGGTSTTRGVHWHIDSNVTYVSSDPRAQTIDWIGVTNPDGSTEEFLAAKEARNATDVRQDIARLKAAAIVDRRMDCMDCHNRVGHGIPSVSQAVDSAMTDGTIDPTLPYVKQQSMDRLTVTYASVGDADHAIDGLRDYYSAKYPLVAQSKTVAIDAAVTDLKSIYELVATPEMRVTAATYPDNLGHQNSPGCFRCHDGAHYKVVNGTLSTETIPSSCATCHTFPQIGAIESGVLIGQRPDTHDDKLWLFDHKLSTTSADPSHQSCGACHTRTYCENCHNTSAVQVPHDQMVYDHAKVVEKIGSQSCAACHQPAYCAQCHAQQVLPNPYPDITPSPSSTSP